MRKSVMNDMTQTLDRGMSLALKSGVSGAKLAFGHSESIESTFEAGRLKDTGGREQLAYNIQSLVDGKIGNTTGNRTAEIDSMVQDSITLAKVGSEAHFEKYPEPGQFLPVKTHSESVLKLTREKMIDDCREMVDILKNYNPDLHVISGASRKESEGALMTSGGVLHTSKNTSWSLYAYCQLIRDTDMMFAHYGRGWRDVNEFYDPKVIAEKVVRKFQWGEKTVQSPKGKVKTLLPPQTLHMFLSAVFMGINGRNVVKGESPLQGRLGERILSPAITILDKPHQDYSFGASEIDDDGVPTREAVLFDKGVLERFLYDLDSAGMAGVEPTGNSGCSPNNPHVVPGERSSEELIQDIDDGIYIESLIGFGQSNIINGDFSSNVGLGYRIENGTITGRIKNTMVSGNIYELLLDNVTLSSNTNYSGQMPHAVVEGLNVSC